MRVVTFDGTRPRAFAALVTLRSPATARNISIEERSTKNLVFGINSAYNSLYENHLRGSSRCDIEPQTKHGGDRAAAGQPAMVIASRSEDRASSNARTKDLVSGA